MTKKWHLVKKKKILITKGLYLDCLALLVEEKNVSSPSLCIDHSFTFF